MGCTARIVRPNTKRLVVEVTAGSRRVPVAAAAAHFPRRAMGRRRSGRSRATRCRRVPCWHQVATVHRETPRAGTLYGQRLLCAGLCLLVLSSHLAIAVRLRPRLRRLVLGPLVPPLEGSQAAIKLAAFAGPAHPRIIGRTIAGRQWRHQAHAGRSPARRTDQRPASPSPMALRSRAQSHERRSRCRLRSAR